MKITVAEAFEAIPAAYALTRGYDPYNSADTNYWAWLRTLKGTFA